MFFDATESEWKKRKPPEPFSGDRPNSDRCRLVAPEEKNLFHRKNDLLFDIQDPSEGISA